MKLRRFTCIAAFAVTLTGGLLVACAEEPQVDAKARDLIKSMSETLGKTQQMTIALKRTTDAGLLEGSDVAVTVEGIVYMQRPNKLAAKVTTPGARRGLVYDGSQVIAVDHEANCYATVPAPGTIDGMLDMLETDYDFTPPLADFLRSDTHAALLSEYQGGNRELVSVKYAGVENIGGESAHHIAVHEKYVDWELWISETTMLPKRFLITATGIEGDPQLQIDLLSTDVTKDIPGDVFTFALPEGCEKIPMPKKQAE